ncbi:MAG TPA: hypothetical protein PKN87_09585 [Syntrophomonadaceae bacterium]|nr:hypothetical protein [Syntrophomonadaceae bacterium]HNX29641.1 hypothetical protein [Syntrophomonadaceae bacterium]HPR94363.1 hypothetical protein [Syntrophomonadaceae bacterium]
MEYESVGRFATEKAKKMLKILRQHVQHIHWELGWGDGYISDVVKYANICVPEFQHDEAEYVIGLLENGEDLSDYNPDNRFPVLFEEKNGAFIVVKPLALFAENVRELIELLDGPPGEDMIEYLHKISQLLLNIYALQVYLPECTGGSYYQPWLGFNLSNKFEPFSLYYDVSDPFVTQVDTRYMDKTLEEILEVLQTGMVHYNMYQETDNYKYLSMAVSVWKNQYVGEFGWGTAVVNALKVLHYACMYLEKGELSKTEAG